jgi:hypothetical protein
MHSITDLNMKKIFVFLFVLLCKSGFPATGSANDGELMAIVVIGIILLLLGVGYGIGMLKQLFKSYISKIRDLYQKRKENQEINNEYQNDTIPSIQAF